MTEPKRGRGRPRREGADDDILAAAIDVLHEKGYRDLTVDEVAERAGVAKTTVYRRWPSKPALMHAAFAGRVGVSEAGEAESILREIIAIKRELSDPELLQVVRELIAPRLDKLREITKSALKAEMMVAPILLRDEVGEDLAAEIVKTLPS